MWFRPDTGIWGKGVCLPALWEQREEVVECRPPLTCAGHSQREALRPWHPKTETRTESRWGRPGRTQDAPPALHPRNGPTTRRRCRPTLFSYVTRVFTQRLPLSFQAPT